MVICIGRIALRVSRCPHVAIGLFQSTSTGLGSDMNNLIEVEFAIFVIEGVAEKLCIAGDAAYRLLAVETNVLQDYVIPSFDVLHTQGKTYVVDDVIGVLRKKGAPV